MQSLIRKARVIDPQSVYNNKVVDLVIDNGIIVEIGFDLNVAASVVIEGADLCVSAGWVDIFADYREPGFEHKETIATGLACAAAGGYTEVLVCPNTQPAVSGKSVVQYLLQRAQGNIVQLHPIGSATQNADGKELAEMLDMRKYGAIAFTDGWKPVQNASLMMKALEYVKAFDGVIVQMPVDAALSSGGLMHEGIMSTRLGMSGIPVIAESLLVHRDIELLRYTKSRLHITGVSTAESVAMIRKAKAEGLAVTCSVTPYHLALTDAALAGYDSAYKVSPPLRDEAHRQALIAALADGTIDCIAAHHRPQEWDAKTKEFDYAADGMAVQEIAFAIVWNAVRDAVTIDRLVDAIAIKPREIFGLEPHTIVKGSNASLTVFTTTGATLLKDAEVKSLSKNNPFIGEKLVGSVVAILNNNQTKVNK